MIRSPAGFDGGDRIKRYLDYYQPSYGVMMLSAGQFSPASLFAAGEQGAWYDPSDFSTMFQESTGVTPVTAVEQPVGLILDKSKGLALGSELVTNGDFSSGTTGWTASASTTLSTDAERLKVTAGSTFAWAYQALTTVIGRTYKLTYSITNGDAVGCYMYVDTAAGSSASNYNSGAQANGTYSAVFVATATTTYVKPFIQGSGKFAFYDNISVKELPGNHARQSTPASCPVLSARVNLLTYTEQFDNAAWVKRGTTTITANDTTDPIGGNTSDLVVGIGADGVNDIYQQSAATVNGVSYVASFYIKKISSSGTLVFKGLTGTQDIDLSTLSTGWNQITITSPATGVVTYWQLYASSGAPLSFYIWGADLRVTNVGVGLPAYQRVAAATDYDTSGFPLYLKFDGVDDSLATGSIDFTATDKVTAWAGVRKLSDAVGGNLVELGTSSSAGGFGITAPDGVAANYGARSTGSISRGLTATTYTAPLTNVLTAYGDISGDMLGLRVNGSLVATNVLDQGTGNYANAALSIGRRGAASAILNGNLYSLIVRGALSTDAQIASTETYVNNLTKAY